MPRLTHTHSGQTHSNQSQRTLSNPSVWFSIKKERLLFVLLPSIFRDKRLKVVAGLKSEEQHNLSLRGPARFTRCGHVGRRHRQSVAVRSSVLGTDVTLAPHTASAACACKGAKAGYS